MLADQIPRFAEQLVAALDVDLDDVAVELRRLGPYLQDRADATDEVTETAAHLNPSSGNGPCDRGRIVWHVRAGNPPVEVVRGRYHRCGDIPVRNSMQGSRQNLP